MSRSLLTLMRTSARHWRGIWRRWPRCAGGSTRKKRDASYSLPARLPVCNLPVVCVCVCVCVCVYTYTYLHACNYIYLSMHACTYTCACPHIHILASCVRVPSLLHERCLYYMKDVFTTHILVSCARVISPYSLLLTLYYLLFTTNSSLLTLYYIYLCLVHVRSDLVLKSAEGERWFD